MTQSPTPDVLCKSLISELTRGSNCDVERCAKLINEGANLHHRHYREAHTALHIAILFGHSEVVKKILEKGTDVNALNNDDHTPLSLAAKEDHDDILNFLLDNGAEINARNSKGATALHCAAAKDHYSMSSILALLNRGIDISIADNNGETALAIAQRLRFPTAIRLISEHKAKLERITSPALQRSVIKPKLLTW